MKVKSILSSIITFLFLSISVFGQTGFKPGYIITSSHDTLKGKIKFYSGQKNHTSCTFLPDGRQEKKTYLPGEIEAYRFNDGKYFISKKTPLYNDTLELFVEFILQGKASFYYVNMNGVKHYYIEAADGFMELTEPEKVVWVDADPTATEYLKPYVQPSQTKNKLKASLSDCPEILPEIDEMWINHKSLIKIGQEYNNLTCPGGECIVFERNVYPVTLKYGVFAGYTLTNINFGTFLSADNCHGITAGMSFGLYNVFSHDERLSVNLDPAVQYTRTLNLRAKGVLEYLQRIEYQDIVYYLTTEPEDSGLPTVVYTDHLKTDATLMLLKLPLTLNYNFGLGKWHYSAGLGPAGSLTLSQNPEFVYTKYSDVFGKSFPLFMLGGTVKGGAEYKLSQGTSFFSGISYELLLNMKKTADTFILKHKTASVVIGIRF